MAPSFSSLLSNPKLPLSPSSLPKKNSHRPPISKLNIIHQQSHWTSIDAEINTHILKSLPKTLPPVVTDPMLHLTSAAPRTLAPALCLAACELVGGSRAHAIDTACALRLIHAASYTHSKLLCPNHKSSAFPLGVELLTGDGIFPWGYELVARSEFGEPERVLRVIIEMTNCMGSNGVVEGQLMEAEGGGDGEIEKVLERKEGRMAACGAACGAIVGGGNEEEVETLRRFGMYIGMMHGLVLSGERGMERAEGFRTLARLELDGFEEGKVDVVRELVDLWYEEGMELQGSGEPVGENNYR